MKTNFIRTILIIIGLTCFQTIHFGQNKNSFDIHCVRAKFTDTTGSKDVIVVFNVTFQDTVNYPPILNIPPKCSILINGVNQDVPLSPENLSVSLNDDKVILKDVFLYELIKDRVDLTSKKEIMLISFKIKDVSSEPFNKMTVTLSLGEKRNPTIKHIKSCEFIVDK